MAPAPRKIHVHHTGASCRKFLTWTSCSRCCKICPLHWSAWSSQFPVSSWTCPDNRKNKLWTFWKVSTCKTKRQLAIFPAWLFLLRSFFYVKISVFSYLTLSCVFLEYRAHECSNKRNRRQKCCREKTYIDFRDLNWARGWIVEPRGFIFYSCGGKCNSKVSRRTCVPTKTASLPVMYMLKTGDLTEVKVTELPNMIVEECGCSSSSNPFLR